MSKQTFTSFPFLIGLYLAFASIVLTIASPAASAREAGAVKVAVPAAQLQGTATTTTTIQSIPSVVIVSPSADQLFTAGEIVQVVSKTADPQGITRVELLVNNQLVARRSNIKAPTNQTLTSSQSWLPEMIGSQVLQVIAYNAAGVTGESELVFVQVQQPTPTPVPATPTLTATPTPAFPYVVVTGTDALQVRTGPGTQYDVLGSLLPQQQARITGRNMGADVWWQINFPLGTAGLGWISGNPQYSTAYYVDAVPVVATPPPPAPTATPTPSSGIDFRVDRTEIQRGECVNFYWNVYGVKAIYFQGEGVVGENQTRRECPPDTTTYTLQVEWADGSTEKREFQINVGGDDEDYITTTVPREDKIDFDNGARSSEQDNDFFWYFEGDQPIFEKADDDNDLRLVVIEPGSRDDFLALNQDTCRSALGQQDQPQINIALDLIVCFSTGEERIGKLRFTGGNREELTMQWHLW